MNAKESLNSMWKTLESCVYPWVTPPFSTYVMCANRHKRKVWSEFIADCGYKYSKVTFDILPTNNVLAALQFLQNKLAELKALGLENDYDHFEKVIDEWMEKFFTKNKPTAKEQTTVRGRTYKVGDRISVKIVHPNEVRKIVGTIKAIDVTDNIFVEYIDKKYDNTKGGELLNIRQRHTVSSLPNGISGLHIL